MMPPPHDPRVTTLDEEAALWAARLDGSELSPSDRSALEAWLAAEPDRRARLAAYCQFSADLEQLLPSLTGMREQAAEIPPALVSARPSPWRRRLPIAGAALTAAAALCVFLLRPADPAPTVRSVATAVGQRQQLDLADGSRVELNAQSALVVALSPAERRVRLASGQAFFRVHRDPARPFIVETPAGSVRVTGTEFDVRTETGTMLEVTVAHGAVTVLPGAAGTADFELTAGDQLTAGPGGTNRQALDPAALARVLAWREGYVVFAGTPLREALGQFARYHGRDLTVSPEVATLRLGGRFSLDDLPGFLSALEAALPVRVRHAADGSVTVGPRTGA